MPITFEEVSADVEREPERPQPARPPAAPTPLEFEAKFEQALRLHAEREDRVCDC
jgi:hypothetical protein